MAHLTTTEPDGRARRYVELMTAEFEREVAASDRAETADDEGT